MGFSIFGSKKNDENKTDVREYNDLMQKDEHTSVIKVDFSNITDNLVKVTFIGQIDESNVEKSLDQVVKEIESRPINVNYIFDFEKLTYINSMGLGRLSEIHIMITEKKGDLIIVKSNPNIMDILKYARLDTIITFADSEEEAITIFKNQ